jgi:molecular chaperone GrpE
MSKSKDEKHRTGDPGGTSRHEAEWELGGEEIKPEPDSESDPIPLTERDVAASAEELGELRAKLAEKDREISDLKDKYLRALADTENTRKRMRQQSEENVRLQRERLLRDLLPIIDNLERAVGAARGGGNGKPIVEGVEMVLRSLLDFLKGHGVTPQESIGRPFDPQFHEAVDHVESNEHRPNTVISEFHRGYQIGDRVLRPARVAVAKPPGPQTKDGGDNGVENN